MPWKATAVWAYQAKEEGELSFNVGDEIIILEERRNGWWKGKRGGEIGEFPVNYCDVEGGTPPLTPPTRSPRDHLTSLLFGGLVVFRRRWRELDHNAISRAGGQD